MVCAVAYQKAFGLRRWRAQQSHCGRAATSAAATVSASICNVYVTDRLGTISAFDKQNAAICGSRAACMLVLPTAPAVMGRFVAVGDYEGYLHLLSTEGRFVSGPCQDRQFGAALCAAANAGKNCWRRPPMDFPFESNSLTVVPALSREAANVAVQPGDERCCMKPTIVLVGRPMSVSLHCSIA